MYFSIVRAVFLQEVYKCWFFSASTKLCEQEQFQIIKNFFHIIYSVGREKKKNAPVDPKKFCSCLFKISEIITISYYSVYLL